MAPIQNRGGLLAPHLLFQQAPISAVQTPRRVLNTVSQAISNYSRDHTSFQRPASGLPAISNQLHAFSTSSWLPPPSQQAYKAVELGNYLLQNVKENKYVLGGTKIDYQNCIVNTDCSGLMRRLWKDAGVSLKGMNAAAITRHIEDPSSPFVEITNPALLQAGDMIGVKMPKASVSGHVMMAWGPPTPIIKDGQIKGYNLRIIDSSSSHSEDIRPNGRSGIGSGIISFSVDSRTGLLDKFYWKANLKGGSYPDVALGRHRG